MKKATERGGPIRKRGIVAMALFPPVQARFAIALLLTFFPYAFLYPLDYPAGELLTLGCWIWVFPSRIGCLSLGLAPLIANRTYGYFAFNLFCLVANLAIAHAAFRSTKLHPKELGGLQRFTKGCTLITLGFAAVQAVTDPYLWVTVFPNIRLEPGRGAGLKFEPSQLASLLALYLILLMARIESMRAARAPLHAQRSLFREGIWIIVATVALTRSFSVVIIVLCFAPALFMRRRHVALTISGLLAGVAVGVSFLGDRISEAFATSGGSMTDLITESVGSWRNIPDILILSNFRDFLLPGNPAEVRIKITACAVQLSPALTWVQNTFSIFSAGGVTVGVLATAAAFLGGIAIGLRGSFLSRPMRTSWLLLYLAAWFILAKWDPSGWVALGLLALMHKLNEPEVRRVAPGLSKKLELAKGEP